MIRESPSFFHRGPSPLARLTFFMIAAFAVMIADHRFHALETVRLSLSVLAHPVQQFAAVPSQALGRIADYFASQERLLRENQELKTQVLEQSAAAQEARLLRAEQEHLLAMSPGKSRYAKGGMLEGNAAGQHRHQFFGFAGPVAGLDDTNRGHDQTLRRAARNVT